MFSRFAMKNAPEVAATGALVDVSQTTTKGTIMLNSTALVIGETSVRQIGDLYALNDLHKAAGNEDKHQPAFFMRREETQALVDEISKSANSQICEPVKSVRGKYGGTYACKELVIAYAAWISAALHLKVIRVFLAHVAPAAAPRNAAIDYDRISPAQAQDLKEIVQAIVQAGVQGFGETWNRLQRKFKVNSYLELPATRHLEAREYLIAKLPNSQDSEVPANPVSELPRLELFMSPPAIGSYRYNPANPHPANGRTIEVAKSIAADIRNWSDNLPAGPARYDLQDAAQMLYDLLVSGWTEVDEALGQLHTAMHYLNRWQGGGARIGNAR